MKNKKMLMIGLVGLLFGVVSQVEAFQFAIDNKDEGDLHVELYRGAIPKAAAEVFTGTIPGKSMSFKDINSDEKKFLLKISSKKSEGIKEYKITKPNKKTNVYIDVKRIEVTYGIEQITASLSRRYYWIKNEKDIAKFEEIK